MDRLYHTTLVGVLLGVGAALVVPRPKAAVWIAWLEAVESRVQALAPPAAAGEPGGVAVASDDPPHPSRDRDAQSRDREGAEAAASAGDYWSEAAAADATDAAADDPNAAAEVPGAQRHVAPAADGGFGAAGPTPEENALLSAEINQLESAQIIAYVGPEVVLAAEVLPRANEFLQAHLDEIPAGQVEAQRLRVVQQLLRGVIDTKAVYAEARREIPAEAWKDVQKQIDASFEEHEIPRLMKRYGAASRADLIAGLRQRGTSLEQEQRTYAEREVARSWAQRQVPQKDEVTYEEMVAWYRQHLADYDLEAKARWEQLTVRFDRFADKAAAWREMARMGNAVLDGTPLEEVARAASHGLTAARGGQRDWTRPGSLASTVLDEALFALPVGQLSPILEDEQGFHIVRVIERQDAGRVPFEEAQVEIRDKIRQERQAAAIDEYLAKVVQRTRIVTIFDPPTDETAGRRPEADVQR